jgi:hypothetical protein
LGPLDTSAFERNLPPPARWLVRAARYPRFYSVLLALLTRLAKLAERLRIPTFELRAVQLLRRMEINAGALEALRSTAYAVEAQRPRQPEDRPAGPTAAT